MEKKARMKIEMPFAEFESRSKLWRLERDRFGNVIAKTNWDSELIVDEELVSMDLEKLAVLLGAGGW